MSVIHIPKRPEIGFRQIFLLVLAALGLTAIFLRLWFLQIVKASELSERAVSYGYETVPSLAPRGLIEDRNGALLAGVKSTLVVTAIPDLLRKNPESLGRLADILQEPTEKLIQKLKDQRGKPFLPCPVYNGVTVPVATRIAEDRDELPGIDVESEPLRYYPDPVNFSHVLGYVWTPNERDLARLQKEGISPQGYIGKTGLEAVYEKDLMGTPGVEDLQVDAMKRPMQLVSQQEPVPGDVLKLSLDSSLQDIAMQQLEAEQQRSPGSGGAVVAIDPKTGEVLCMASNPGYDASLFLQGIKSAQYKQLVNDPMKPLFDRAIDGDYSPGSTFKLVSTIAAAHSGTFDPNRIVYCPGYFKIGNRKIKCLGHHGALGYFEALTKSCNTYFCDLAMRTGPQELVRASLEFGLGQRSGIDLPGEGKAVVPTNAWLRSIEHTPAGKPPVWYPGDTANMGIGQGYISATPLQMADVACMVANQGFCFKPHVVEEILPADGSGEPQKDSPQVEFQTTAPSEIWADLKSAMINVIEHGTARSGRIDGITWAGKTGSTEHSGPDKKTHGWFVGYAPADDPKIAIAVLIEEGGHGGAVSAPIAAAVVRRYLEELKLLPSEASAASNVERAPAAQSASPLSPVAR